MFLMFQISHDLHSSRDNLFFQSLRTSLLSKQEQQKLIPIFKSLSLSLLCLRTKLVLTNSTYLYTTKFLNQRKMD